MQVMPRLPRAERRGSKGLRAFLILLSVLAAFVFSLPLASCQDEGKSNEESGDVVVAGAASSRKAIFETPYLCRLGKRYPWIRAFVDERLSMYADHIEWRETGGNPRLLVFEGNAIKTLFHFGDGHKDVEEIIREKLEL
ncbi:hypothetical protein HOP50_15g74830 [Chloropicon primus]|uniref:Uncharacterized protein n=1 Tax=Chloropicon primus TaxID=1764295 RepID=A0A5B8MZH0_9CHLO|nr:hypothetical protein A3770_15p74580 [Chloropicon primus]UPR04149.1 hypothetical protein HOP50_15g74830 [Chloropicon primus]|eukprot:QDZ24940.1 hypothetical protein A3770_15p74580 [Chloropicon primus]